MRAVLSGVSFILSTRQLRGDAGFLHVLQGIFRLLLIVDVEVGQARPGLGEAPEIRGKGDAGQFPAEVGGVFLPVGGMVQQGIDVMEDVPLGDGVIVVMGAKLLQGPVGEVFPAVGAVFGVGVEGEALGGGAKTSTQIQDQEYY